MHMDRKMRPASKGIIKGIFCLGFLLFILAITLKGDITLLSLQIASRDLDWTTGEGQDFIFPDTGTPGGSNTGPRLNESADMLFRQIETDVYNTKQYILANLKRLKDLVQNKAAQNQFTVVTEDIKHHFRVTQYDIWRFRTKSGLQAWQTKEIQKLSDLIQHRIHGLQNPSDCNSAKKLLCNYPMQIKTRLMASQLHHLSYCVTAAYGTQRTLIIKAMESDSTGLALSNYFLPLSENCTTETRAPKGLSKHAYGVLQFPDTDKPVPRPAYLPRSIPKDIAHRLMNAHGDPFAWWMGQLLKYPMRMNGKFKDYIEKQSSRLGYESPIVGVQIRRTDKINTEAIYIALEEYMEAVDDFFKDLEMRGNNEPTRRIYLATDDMEVLYEAKKKYPNYEILFNKESIASASMDHRDSVDNKRFLMADIYFLSRSDFLVCGMSSNICRLAYELMHTLHPDADRRVFSVDSPYWFHFQSPQLSKARYPHEPRRAGELQLQEGDLVKDTLKYFWKQSNPHDGFQHGMNLRTRKVGLYPVYKMVDALRVANTPSYDLIDKRKM